MKVVLLDDYQEVARQYGDWDSLPSDVSVEIYQDHLSEDSDLVARLKDADVVMALRERTHYQRPLLEQLPNLKMITSAGMRNAAIDMDACTEMGILVCGTTGSSRATMELTWALILSLLRQIPREHNATTSGATWQQTLGIGLEGKTLGIMGLGNIGGQAAEVARAFHMNIIAWSQNLTKERAAECGAELVSKEVLMANSDILTIHLKLSERTTGLIGASDLALMKPTAFLVNTSRGPIVDEAALIDTLQRKAIAGAGIDVFDVEPLPKDHPLLKLDNTVITPHMGYVTQETYVNFYTQTVENIKAYMEGSPVRVMNPEVLETRRGL